MNLIGTKTLETERLILRKLTKEDAYEAFINWCSKDIVCKYVLWEKHENIDVTKELFEMWEKEYENPKTFRWIVQVKETNKLIGTIDVVGKRFFDYGSCEIGYCYGDEFWNKGYATEALSRVVKFLFEEVGAEIVYAEHLNNNPASGKVMEKSGMKKEGILRSRIIDKDGIRNDLTSYSITKDEYFSNLQKD